MSCRIVHFGVDDCWRVAVLRHAGHAVETCGTSMESLTARLQTSPDAVVFTEDGEPCGDDYFRFSRSLSVSPIVLFEGLRRCIPSNLADLPIPVGTNVAVWLPAINALIEETRRLRGQTRDMREKSALLSEQEQRLRVAAASARQRLEKG